MENLKYKILILLFGISLLSSLILSLIPIPVVCDPGVGCDVVQTSIYNNTFGIKNSYYGVAIFFLLILLTFSHIQKPSKTKKMLIHSAVILGSIVALYFIYLQVFVLQAFCKYCMIVDISTLLSLALVLWKWKE